MSRKAKILVSSYLVTTIAVLALYAWAGQWGLGWYRRSARESGNLAYEETVRAVETLSAVLEKSVYATDSEMCDRICCEAYACAAAAESAMSTLPFSTQELEQLSAFLNTAGDYAYSLCGQGQGFSREQRQQLGELADGAADFSRTLLALREDLNDRALTMDSREKRLRNVGADGEAKLSEKLLDYEADFAPLSLHYDGKYGGEAAQKSSGLLTEGEMQAAAARFLGVPETELQLEYQYEGTDGRRCYRAGDIWLCVSRSGVESMAQNRIVSEETLTVAQARQAAEKFLKARGYGDLTLLEGTQNGSVAVLRYVREQDGALCPENGIRIGIALDDGSVYSFDAKDYSSDPVEVSWTVEQDAAAQALPEDLRVEEIRPVILQSPGGLAVPCYAFFCTDPDGRPVEICVSAETGKQFRITLGEKS